MPFFTKFLSQCYFHCTIQYWRASLFVVLVSAVSIIRRLKNMICFLCFFSSLSVIFGPKLPSSSIKLLVLVLAVRIFKKRTPHLWRLYFLIWIMNLSYYAAKCLNKIPNRISPFLGTFLFAIWLIEKLIKIWINWLLSKYWSRRTITTIICTNIRNVSKYFNMNMNFLFFLIE